MRFSFIYPFALWLLLVLVPFWVFTFSTRTVSISRLGRWRFAALVLLRSVMLIALVLALAGTQLVRPVTSLATVFLVDGSDSVSPALRGQALQYINSALAAQRDSDEAAVVVFGENALVERAPSQIEQVAQLNSAVFADRTNIADAIQLGLALLPADAQKRLVLLSDGGENEGQATEAARLATLRNVPIDVVPLQGQPGNDVIVSALDVPSSAREGQDIPLTVKIESSIATEGQLQIFADNELVGTQAVTIEPGSNEVGLNLPSGEAGFRRFEVRLEAAGDTQSLNNRAAAFTTVQGPPRVMLVASDANRAAPLQNALQAANIRVELVSPTQMPAEQAQLRQYAAVVLVDVLAADVPAAVEDALPIYVREQGGSLAMIGGSESFGAGGWRRSPVADALPVDLDPKSTEERPDLALALVIDRSGSMADTAIGGITKLDLAKEAVYQASLGLEQSDQIEVVAFDDSAITVLPVQPLPSLVNIEQAIGQISEGGGTNIRSGVEVAAESLATTEARVKHVILLTDGIADSNYADLIDQMRANNVTITIVSIGDDANPALTQIAQRGGGEFYRVQALADVPRIFLAETVRVAQRDIVEKPFTPVATLLAPPIRDLGGVPPLYGYNATTPRPAARNILVSDDGAPILATWQYGLGRGLAWTSDLKGQWARDWVTWDQFPRFAVGLIDTLLPPQQNDNLTLDARSDQGQAILTLDAVGADGQPVDRATVEGRLLKPDDTSVPISFTQVGVGQYRAVVPTDAAGVYLAQVAVLSQDGQALGNASSGVVVSYSPEYGPRSDNPLLLDTLASLTGGRENPPATQVFEPTNQSVGVSQDISLPLIWLALLLLPFDIGLRRVFLRRNDLAPALNRLRPAPRATTTETTAAPTMSRLRAARDRAGHRASAAPQRPQPEPSQQPAVAQQTLPPPPKPVPPKPTPTQQRRAAAPTSDDALASLLIAKQRARRKQRDGDGE